MSSRRERGLTQSIYLVKLDIFKKSLVFHVLGTSQRVYKVTCSKETAPKCSCPDHCTRKSICKHIYFVCERVMNITPTDWMLIPDISPVADKVLQRLPHLHVTASDAIIKKYEQHLQQEGKKKKGEQNVTPVTPSITVRNSECCICLEDIPSDMQSTNIMVCFTCNNGIHSICWNKWKQVNKGDRCVYCRSKVENAKNDKHANLEKAGWGVLLQ